MEGLPGTPSVHQIGFADLIATLRLLGKFPQKMVLFGVQPQETGWAASLSEPVDAALPALVDAIIDQLQEWMPKPKWRTIPDQALR